MRVLALDIGTSSIRASIYDSRLRPVRTARVPCRWRESAHGRVETAAPAMESLVAQAVDACLDGARPPIDAVGVAAFWHSLVGVGPRGAALTPLYPWSDRRAAAEAAALARALDERAVHARTGCRLHATYWPARLRWFRRHDRALFRRATWMSFPEYLERRWLGRLGGSISQASATGLMEQGSCEWDPELLEACGVSPARLSPILPPSDEAALRTDLRRRWPALAGARWFPAVGDGAAGNVGAGCVTRHRAAVMIGTSGAVRVLWRPARGERVRVRFGIWRYRLDDARVVVGGALSNAGNLREWLIRSLAGDDAAAARLERRALGLPPDAHCLTVLPFLAGTRSPDYVANAKGTIHGLTLATRPEHILRAAMEAVAYRFATALDELERTHEVRDLVAAGGVLERSTGWTQVLADVLGRPIRHCGEREFSSRGAAALALEQLGALRTERLSPPPGRRIAPDPGRHAIYTEARARQRRLTSVIRERVD